MSDIVSQVKFNKDGLVPTVIQDIDTGEVLMLAYMNDESLRLTLETKKAHYYSRSRQKLWLKGESSKHFQHVKEVYIDCDVDCILIKVKQDGGACHTGYKSCFYRKLNIDTNEFETTSEKVFDPEKTYKKS